MSHAPTLHTDRLTLRPHRADDLDACAALWTDPAVVRFIGGVPQDRQAVWFRLLRYAGMWTLLGFGMWVIEDRETGAFLGEAGLMRAERGVPELTDVPEAGWVLAPGAWGRGVAGEAMAAVTGWADQTLDAPSIRCIIDPGNVASIQVAQRLGFSPLTDVDMGGNPIRVFERIA